MILLCSGGPRQQEKTRTAAEVEVAKIRTKRAAQMDHQVRVQMGTRLEPMGPLENAAGAAKDWTKNSNVHRMVAGRAIQEPSICIAIS
jgi:hypothetical protein